MAHNLDTVGGMADYIEMIVGMAGINRDEVNRELIYTMMNEKIRDFAAVTGAVGTNASISSVADQQEYQLPADVVFVTKVFLDGSRIRNRINSDALEDITG